MRLVYISRRGKGPTIGDVEKSKERDERHNYLARRFGAGALAPRDGGHELADAAGCDADEQHGAAVNEPDEEEAEQDANQARAGDEDGVLKGLFDARDLEEEGCVDVAVCLLVEKPRTGKRPGQSIERRESDPFGNLHPTRSVSLSVVVPSQPRNQNSPISRMETNYRNRKQCPPQIRPPPHLQEQSLLILLELLPRRLTNLIKLSLKLELVNVGVAQAAQRPLGRVFLALRHQPARRLRGEEEHQDGLQSGRDEEDGQRNLVGVATFHGVGAEVDARADNGADGQHHLIHGEGDAS
jgi:hypothetical protein